jgi:phosphoenolpyruvate carboxykinase (ATP)
MSQADAQKEAIAKLGIRPGTLRWNLLEPALIEETIRRGTGRFATGGPLVVDTTPYTGRSPNDKFIVKSDESESDIAWGKVNRDISPETFDKLYDRVCAHLSERELFVQDLRGGCDPNNRIAVRLVSESPWHALFARNLLVRTPADELADFAPDFHIVHAPEFEADPKRDGTNSEVFVLLNLARRIVLIGGTRYAGEIKKSVFTLLNYLLPKKGVMAMHCSANVGQSGDVSLFFGLSGTGKTTLSADPERPLIGDDEHGWSESGVFNFEGGCYAKVIKLERAHEPEIFATTERFGTVLENVVMDDGGELDLNDGSKTENTRSAYPITHLPNIVASGMAGHPNNIVFLTCDAFGVLPPISKLTTEQAMYYFLSGYTAKVAGTERGITEPQATFSACFGEPFLPLHPGVYAEMLGKKIEEHRPNVWLLNTGWTAGPFGTGHRIAIPHTRAMVRAMLSGNIADDAWTTEPFFGLRIPTSVDGVPSDILDPKSTWESATDYDAQANKLAQMFRNNFERYSDRIDDAIKKAAPGA